MNSECVDLIYLDPPFNSKTEFSAPIGSQATGAMFSDIWKIDDIKEEWIELFAKNHPPLHRILQSALADSNKAYLAFMAIRLLEMHRILKPTGSIFLHCDPTMSHWLKIVMDYVFGIQNFRNEIIWHYRTYKGKVQDYYPKKHDVILWYAKSEKHFRQRKTFELEYLENYEDTVDFKRWKKFYLNGNKIYFGKHPNTDVRFTSYLKKWIKDNGREPFEGELIYECKGYIVDDVWMDIQAIDPKNKSEKTGYPTQKPISLLERVVSVSTNEGDFVFDPFCGCATTLVAAEAKKRKWTGIDISKKAVEILNYRIFTHDKVVREDIPERTDLGKLPNPRSMEIRQKLYGKQQGFCAGCTPPMHFELRHLEVDHIIAKSIGGTDHESNLQLLCSSCNRIKGNRGMKYLKAKLSPEENFERIH